MKLREGSDGVFPHPGMVPGTQPVLSDYRLSSDKYFLDVSC